MRKLYDFTLHILASMVFPRRDYLNESSVRHARREWVKAIQYLNRTK